MVKCNNLTGADLDYAVALCEGWTLDPKGEFAFIFQYPEIEGGFNPSTNWKDGGPIIEKHGINVSLRYGSLPPNHVQDSWDAIIKPAFYSSGRPGSGVKKEVIASGPFPLIAAMRCYVLSKLGDEIDIPEQLRDK